MFKRKSRIKSRKGNVIFADFSKPVGVRLLGAMMFNRKGSVIPLVQPQHGMATRLLLAA